MPRARRQGASTTTILCCLYDLYDHLSIGMVIVCSCKERVFWKRNETSESKVPTMNIPTYPNILLKLCPVVEPKFLRSWNTVSLPAMTGPPLLQLAPCILPVAPHQHKAGGILKNGKLCNISLKKLGMFKLYAGICSDNFRELYTFFRSR